MGFNNQGFSNFRLPNYPVELKTTASTGTRLEKGGMTVLKSTKTAKTFTMSAPEPGDYKILACISATATGFVKVDCGAKFDGTNDVYKFLKGSATAPTMIHLCALNSTKWIEVYRSVADGTSIASTST